MINRLLLLSSSPRRREILSMVGVPFRVFSNFNVEEVMEGDPLKIAVSNALLKLQAGAFFQKKDEIALAADTLVVFEDKIYGKPKDEKEAVEILEELSGNVHTVITGFAMKLPDNRVLKGFDISNVKFKSLSNEEIKWYVGTGEPLDKAGAYGIQGKGALFVERIEGDFFNVMGLPIGKIYDILLNNNIDIKSFGG
ncbi:Maf family protein [Desulfurobacterium atlanticum]|uniref:dTTP/UTP pyrophosphatase n=1 Tax=Desulfurobacterium atlanticum TaxID=240169 RepID=A0A238XSV2_9BACT|nr:Maf family protein [Desulfurobacterium atlanticum]SNR62116.1 septum formation protein [Desulfurobacterium atlanticum]